MRLGLWYWIPLAFKGDDANAQLEIKPKTPNEEIEPTIVTDRIYEICKRKGNEFVISQILTDCKIRTSSQYFTVTLNSTCFLDVRLHFFII